MQIPPDAVLPSFIQLEAKGGRLAEPLFVSPTNTAAANSSTAILVTSASSLGQSLDPLWPQHPFWVPWSSLLGLLLPSQLGWLPAPVTVATGAAKVILLVLLLSLLVPLHNSFYWKLNSSILKDLASFLSSPPMDACWCNSAWNHHPGAWLVGKQCQAFHNHLLPFLSFLLTTERCQCRLSSLLPLAVPLLPKIGLMWSSASTKSETWTRGLPLGFPCSPMCHFGGGGARHLSHGHWGAPFCHSPCLQSVRFASTGATLTSAQDVENEVSSFFSVIFNGAISKLEGSGVPFFSSPAHFPTFPKKRETP